MCALNDLFHINKATKCNNFIAQLNLDSLFIGSCCAFWETVCLVSCRAKDATSKAKKGKKGGGPTGSMTDFSDSLLSTDPDDEPDLSKMTEAEKTKYWADKKKRQEEREKKRRAKYGDKYDEMMEKHQL